MKKNIFNNMHECNVYEYLNSYNNEYDYLCIEKKIENDIENWMMQNDEECYERYAGKMRDAYKSYWFGECGNY